MDENSELPQPEQCMPPTITLGRQERLEKRKKEQMRNSQATKARMQTSKSIMLAYQNENLFQTSH